MTRPVAKRTFDGWFLAAVFLAALALRFLPVRAATEGGLRLISPDCYGHLRRSLSVARHFPHVPVRDATLDFPNGAVWIWAPLFDLAIGGIARAAYGAGVTMDEVARVGAILPPFLGALHVLPLFALARRALSRRRARIAVAAYAVLPASVLWSAFGHMDHHVAEGLMLLTVLAAAAAAVQARERVGPALLTGGALGLAVLTWHGAVFIAPLLFGWAAFALGPAAALLAVTAAAVAALGTALTLGGSAVPFSFVSFGWFQPLFLAALALPLVLHAAWAARGRLRAAALAGAVVLAACVLPNARPLLGAVFRGSAFLVVETPRPGLDDYDHVRGGFLSYPPELLRLIFEAFPLLRPPYLDTAELAVRELSIGLVLLPIALLLWTRSALRARPARRALRLLLVVFGGALLVMTLFQRRNTYYLAAFTALALAELVARLPFRRFPAPGRARLAPVALALLLVLAPGLGLLSRVHAYADAPGRDFLDLMTRLRRLDPPPVDLADLPPARATESVMGPWSAGHYVSALSGWPAAADPFAYGWRRQCRLFTTNDDAEARAILASARSRYLVTTAVPPGVLSGYAAAAGRAGAPVGEMFLTRVHASDAPRPLPFLTLVLASRTASRAPDGRLVPRFKVYRIGAENVAPPAPGADMPVRP